MDAYTLLGDVIHPAFGHPKALAPAYDHVYHEGQEMGKLPLRGRKSVDQSAMVYQAEYAQIVHRLSTLTRIDSEKFVRLLPTSLVHPEMVYPNKKYEAYCLKVSESRPVAQYEQVSSYEMDRLRPRIDLRPGVEVPVYPQDGVDADPRFHKYPTWEEFVEGPDWVPSQIPPKIRSPEYGGSSSDASFDTQAARAIEAVSVTIGPGLDEASASTSATGDTRKVELSPLPGLGQQLTLQMEQEIQKRIWEQSRKLVQEVLTQSANRVMPPPLSEAAQASLCQCFQMALAAPDPTPAPSPRSKEGLGEPTQYSLADPFAGINPPPPEILKESCPMSQSSWGRMTTQSEPSRVNHSPDEKKRRSSSCPKGEADPKRGHSSGAEPSWNLSHIGGRHSNKAPSEPAKQPEAPEAKLKSVVTKVRLDKTQPVNLEDLGPAARSRYDTTGQDRVRGDKSRPHTKPSNHSKDHRHSKSRPGHSDKGSSRKSGRHDWNSDQSTNQESVYLKGSMAAKLVAHKERDKKYRKIVENPMMYLEEQYHQIDPAEHQPEVHSLRFFGAGAESAAIEVLALIDWATEFLELSRSPVPEIPAFLRRLFVVGKKVQFPIPEDPGDAIYKEKCVCTKAQKAWVYLCALLQFWTDLATTESGEILYGGQRRPANPLIMRIRAVLNPSFGEHFRITWASVAASTSWTQACLYYGPPERERFRMEPGPTSDLQNPLETAVEERWETYLREGVQETKDLSFTTPSWAGVAGHLQLPEARHPTEVESVPLGFTCLQHGTLQEQEAVSKYWNPPEDSQKQQSIDKELGIQDITDINESWYPPTEKRVGVGHEKHPG